MTKLGNTYRTGRPTGSRRFQSDFTPMPHKVTREVDTFMKNERKSHIRDMKAQA
jgi:hypothetical protein